MGVAVTVSTKVSPHDTMLQATKGQDLDRYLANGRQAAALMKSRCDSPHRILDFGCGHGRVLRHIVAEWPEAEVWACDLDPDAVQFCQQEFNVRGLLSATDPAALELPRFDLIWVGSVFSHLEPFAWHGFLRLLAESLEGVMLLTLEGPYVADCLRAGEEMGAAHETEGLLADFDAHGFAYRDYPYSKQKGYGITLVSPERARAAVENVGLHLVAHLERGWIGRQDVVVASRARETGRA